ncbi:hypothetical protein LTR48_008912, partial [Friedmanniomyces endolithicus]
SRPLPPRPRRQGNLHLPIPWPPLPFWPPRFRPPRPPRNRNHPIRLALHRPPNHRPPPRHRQSPRALH